MDYSDQQNRYNQEIVLPWILAGYTLFAKEGPGGLKVESMARMVAKSKSSFYHHFADMEIFTALLLSYHLERARMIADREALCTKMEPDFLCVLLEHRDDLFFSRSLRVHRDIPMYKACFEESNRIVGDAFLAIWANELGLSEKKHLARDVLGLVIENFYLQITPETLNYEWLLQYIGKLRTMIREMYKG